jgi:hypothetical protein
MNAYAQATVDPGAEKDGGGKPAPATPYTAADAPLFLELLDLLPDTPMQVGAVGWGVGPAARHAHAGGGSGGGGGCA